MTRSSGSVPDATIPVRDGERFDAVRLLDYLRENLPSLPGGNLEVRQFPTGASNLTYWIRVGKWEAVLRRPPFGPVPPRAHDMEREGRLLGLLHPAFPLAPRPYLVCTDPAVIGAPFHIMEYRRGILIDARLPSGVRPTVENFRTIATMALDTLVALHEIDYRDVGLAELGRPEGFLQRQVDGWIGRYRNAVTGEIEGVEPLMEWLLAGCPKSPAATVIHNDFKLNNLLYDAESLRVAAVLDWEMATIGDPLMDLAIFLCYWPEAGDSPALRAILPSVSARPGFPGRAELAARYADRSGRDIASLDWYRTFGYFKLAVILQQIYARWVRGQTSDPRFGQFGESVRTLIAHAYAMTAATARAR